MSRTETAPPDVRSTAVRVVALFVATLALLVLLGVAFDEEVQTVGAPELVARQDAARAFFAADVVFVVVYAILLPLAVRRFGDAAGLSRWLAAGILLLCAAGAVDAVENGLLLSATGSVAEGRVDAAHALAAPKIALWVTGIVVAFVATARAAATLRRSPAAPG